jgi:FMN phosphatase YigB (HAD superfamily)
MASVAPENTWYVGDSIRADARGALAAGLTPIWVDRWNDNWHDRPNEVVRVPNVSAITELLA